MIDFETLQALSGGRAKADAACPLCGPGCKTPTNRTRKVLRIYNPGPGFATYYCARCGTKDFAHADSGDKPKGGNGRAVEDQIAKRFAAAVAAPLVKTEPAPDKSAKARYWWSQRRPIAGSIAERYLRDCRGYHGPLPETLGFLPARGDHPPSMVAAFGIPNEPTPGRLVVNDDAVTAVHFTKLRPDGSSKAGTAKDKTMLGPAKGQPIVLRPVNDLGGLLIAEGIENALACHASGLGLWAAGSAPFLPDVADKVPDYVEAVTIVADVDDSGAGLRKSKELGQLLLKRGLDVRLEMRGHHG
jgi:hypothetical protein